LPFLNYSSVLDPEKDVLKQVLLESMNGTIKWDSTDSAILSSLKKNLESEDSNTRYLSLFLIQKTTDRSFLTILTRLSADDPDPDVRVTVIKTLDILLGGDVGYYFELLESGSQDHDRPTLTLLLELSWDYDNALKAIPFFTDERWRQAEQPGQLLTQLAARIYPVCPREIESFIRKAAKASPWLFALASAWLANINPLNTENNKKHWLTLLRKRIPGLQGLLVQKAIDNKSTWAIEHLQQSLEFIKDPAVAGQTKNAVKAIIEQ